jgi:hypothetical protein
MKIIALEKELNDSRTSDFKKYAHAEAKVLWQLYLKGIVREFYFQKDENLAVLVLEVKSKQAANKELRKLPFVNKKLIKFELIPLKPYTGFERLFK